MVYRKLQMNRASFSLVVANTISSVLAGLLISFFLMALNNIIVVHEQLPYLIYLLPLAALCLAWARHSNKKRCIPNVGLIVGDIQKSSHIFSVLQTPFIFMGTLLSHLVGASVGREGAALLLGSGMSDVSANIFTLTPTQRQLLLKSGLAAAFSAAIGTPWAGICFAFEVSTFKRYLFLPVKLKDQKPRSPHILSSFILCLQASWIAYIVSSLCHAPHSQLLKLQLPSISYSFTGSLLIAGACFGLFSRLFISCNKWIKKGLQSIPFKKNQASYLRSMLGAFILLALLSHDRLFAFRGLGLQGIQSAFEAQLSLSDPLLKLFYTSLSLSSGFIGGDFTPLVFVGATLGSALSAFLAAPTNILAALGFVSVFAGAARIPITGAVLAGELFGWHVAPLALATCLISTFFSSPQGIYDPPACESEN